MPVSVFVTDVDTPIAHQVSRRLAATKVGSRRPAPSDGEDGGGNGDDDRGNAGGDEEGDDKGRLGGRMKGLTGGGDAAADMYMVSGTCKFRVSDEDDIPEELQTDSFDLVGKTAETRDLMASISTPGRPASHIVATVPRFDKEALKQAILDSKVIIVDFINSIDDVPFILQVLNDNAAMFVDDPKTVIALSTVMTWGRTKPDPEDPDAPLAEDEYRRRKPHPNFRTHVQLEKEWAKLAKKECYRAYIVFAGLVYHVGDSVFHPMLKAAWHGSDVLVYGEGENFLPMIHLEDLCELLVLLVEKTPDAKYVLAVDDSRVTYGDVARTISQTLGNGKVKGVPKEQAVLDRDLNQTARDLLGANLKFEATIVKKLGIKWKCESGLLENMAKFVDEFRRGRGLVPLKVVLLGPPCIGKTHYAQKLANHYKLPLLDVDAVMRETMDRLARRVQLGMALLASESGGAPPGDGGADGASAEARMAALAAAAAAEQVDPADMDGERELLEELTEFTKNNGGAYPDVHVTSFLRAKLASMACQNQGYILDGYPATRGAAAALLRKDDGEGGGGVGGSGGASGGMGGGGEGSGEDEEGARPVLDTTLVPGHVIVLDAPDEWIKDRAMQRPETEVTPRTSEEGLTARLAEYRARNTDESTVLNLFDEAEIHPAFFNVVTGAAGPVTGVMSLIVPSGAAGQGAGNSGSTIAGGASTLAGSSAGGLLAGASGSGASGSGNAQSGPNSTGAGSGAQGSGSNCGSGAVGSAKPVDLMLELIKLLGKPHNYGPSKEDIALRKRVKAEEAAKIAQRMEQEERTRQEEERERHAKAVADWNAKLDEVKRQEQQVLEAQSLPLRHYLMQHVMPVLSSGLMEVCKVRPEDPIDYLAEYLFRHAPVSTPGMDPLAAMGLHSNMSLNAGSPVGGLHAGAAIGQSARSLGGSVDLPPTVTGSRSPSSAARPSSGKKQTVLPPIGAAASTSKLAGSGTIVDPAPGSAV
ncbi:hypothetical protein H9P43_004135 [Blastocladiella emersonii ATCC 22665]|nr:hypothetical protein H9P43_004135 [Blastocladiella emersonii ATCC 22665]